jgi:diguanylate cyclase (GGDEF)-like protein/PAS domain S-box-containing protein
MEANQRLSFDGKASKSKNHISNNSIQRRVVMLMAVRKWLAPPVFPGDEIKTRRAGVLNAALINILTIIPILLIGNLLGGKTPLPVYGANLAALVLCLGLRAWMYRGAVREAGLGLLTLGSFLVTAGVIGLGTVRAPTTALYILLVITAGLLFETRGIVLSTAVYSILVAGLILGENAGLLPQPDYSVTITQWIAYTAIFAWTGSLVFSALQSIRKTFERAERELAVHRQMGVALHESEEKYRLLFDNAGDAIFIHDETGRIQAINALAIKNYGYTRDEFLSMTAAQVDSPEESQSMPDRIERLVRQGYHTFETVHQRKDGSLIPTDVSARRILWEGKPAVMSICRDITERKRAEKALKQSEKKYRAIIESSPIPYAISDDHQNITLLNPAFVQTFGYTLNDIPTLADWWRKAYPDAEYRQWVAATWQAHLEKAKLEGAGFEPLEVSILCKDGSRRIVLAGATSLSGSFSETYLVILYDITARKQMEEALRTSEEKFRAVINQSNEGIILIDRQGVIVEWNRQQEQSTGITRSQALGVPMWELSQLMDGISDPNLEHLHKGLEELKKPLKEINLNVLVGMDETTHRLPDGSLRFIEHHYFPVNTDTQIFWANASNDITERKQAEESLRYIGTHDALTAIFNRAFFETELARYEPSRDFPISIIMADLDNMKTTNDRLGHSAGDKLLQHTAQVLKEAFRASDILARIGGDEFSAILPNTDAAVTEHILSRIRVKLNEHNAQFPELPIQMSLGAATADHGRITEAFIIADHQMYINKASRKANNQNHS